MKKILTNPSEGVEEVSNEVFNPMPKPKKKKKAKTTYMKDCDTLLSKIVRSKGTCQLAGLDEVKCKGSLQTMHIISRSNQRLRFDNHNLLCGCAAHHAYYTYRTWEWGRFIWINFHTNFEYIEIHRQEQVHRKPADWRDLKETLVFKHSVIFPN